MILRSCLLALSCLLPSPALAAREDKTFHEGVRRYAEGDVKGALASFREVARREPGHRAALAAIRRLEIEAAKAPADEAKAEARPGLVERFVREVMSRWRRPAKRAAAPEREEP